MLWLCLVACEALPLALQGNAAADGAIAAVSIEQGGATASVAIDEGSTSASVTIDVAADAQGRSVGIVRPVQARSSARPAFAYQAAGGRVRLGRTWMTSGFGMRYHPVYGGERFHQGIDLAAPFGAPIFSAGEGVVSAAGWHGGYGLLVALNHARGMQTRYGHMSRLSVGQGQYVHKGQLLGYVGATGVATGPHLHYEVRVNGAAVNPVPH